MPISQWSWWRRWVIGLPRDPFSPGMHQHIALVAFLAWIGLGADGLSSSCYGPEEAYLALGSYHSLALYLAIATAVTVIVISLAYSQLVSLFPSGGGGYKVATRLIGPNAGLVSGVGLMVDYTLTIAISVASGVDAVLSFFPDAFSPAARLFMKAMLIVVLIILNLRGMKESIRLLMPVFLLFVISHFLIIVFGIGFRFSELINLVPQTWAITHEVADQSGWYFLAALLLRAYSLGGGTYTGLESVSTNLHVLAEPRVRTGRWTMLYMASSLAVTASGILLLYCLWQPIHTAGSTLNASTFALILSEVPYGDLCLVVLLCSEAALLFVGANTGFLGGPTVLANMAVDGWVPNRFRHLSTRLVTQNGVLLFGVAALMVLWWSGGRVGLLIVLYSINVFLTFTLSILGLCIFWWRQRSFQAVWRKKFLLCLFALVLTSSVLIITLVVKFKSGGWVTLLITGSLVFLCACIQRHYRQVSRRLRLLDATFATTLAQSPLKNPLPLNSEAPTAVLLVGRHLGPAVHTLLWVLRMFPRRFKNFVFVRAGEVDVESFNGADALQAMRQEVENSLQQLVNFCTAHGLAARYYYECGPNTMAILSTMPEFIAAHYPRCVFFTNKLIFEKDHWFLRMLHNETPNVLQRKLHLAGLSCVILPMKI